MLDENISYYTVTDGYEPIEKGVYSYNTFVDVAKAISNYIKNERDSYPDLKLELKATLKNDDYTAYVYEWSTLYKKVILVQNHR